MQLQSHMMHIHAEVASVGDWSAFGRRLCGSWRMLGGKHEGGRRVVCVVAQLAVE